MYVATLAAILGHADLRSVMKYVHVRQEAQDRAMKTRKVGDSARTLGKGLSSRRIN
jgi:hypothetical protein